MGLEIKRETWKTSPKESGSAKGVEKAVSRLRSFWLASQSGIEQLSSLVVQQKCTLLPTEAIDACAHFRVSSS